MTRDDRPAYLRGGLDAIPALMAEVDRRAASLREALNYLACPEWCTYCGAWFDLWVSGACPVCHWSGDPGAAVILHCRLMTAAEARDERGLTDEEMRP
jgi:hypothetical protein